MKRKVLCMLFAVMLLVAFFARGAIAAEKEIRIGFITDLTSMLSINGISMRQAAILAMEEVGYKVAGKPAKLLVEDEASDPAIAMDKARRLVETDKIALLLGPFHGGCSSAVAEYVNKTRHLNLSCSYSVPDQAQSLPLDNGTLWEQIIKSAMPGVFTLPRHWALRRRQLCP